MRCSSFGVYCLMHVGCSLLPEVVCCLVSISLFVVGCCCWLTTVWWLVCGVVVCCLLVATRCSLRVLCCMLCVVVHCV